MKRREFIAALGGAAAWPRSLFAQQAERLRRIAVLMGYGEGDADAHARITVLRRALQDLGWIEGRNAQFEYRFATADANLRRKYAAELVSGAPDVTVANTLPV